jgi:23S rRNA (guanosine2251-2'-O)-methyltransferase
MAAKGDLSGSAREIVAMARERGVPVHEVDRAALERLSPAHQGLVAIASAYKYSSVEDILARAAERGEEPLVIILDGVTDPHNLGAIIRSAECAGAHGVIIPDRRAAGLTASAVKASAGAVEHLPVARVVNISRTLAELKEQGLWILAAHTGGEDYAAADLSGPVALVIGSEGEGVSRLVLEKSDKRVALPIRGRTESLNASVAAGILLYEVTRRRGV